MTPIESLLQEQARLWGRIKQLEEENQELRDHAESMEWIVKPPGKERNLC